MPKTGFCVLFLHFIAVYAFALETNYLGGADHRGIFSAVKEELNDFEYKQYHTYHNSTRKLIPNSSTPFIHDGKLFFMYDRGVMYFDMRDFMFYDFELETWGKFYSSPIVHNNMLYTGSSSPMRLYGIRLENGKMKKVWQYDVCGGLLSSPAAVDNRIFFYPECGNLLCFNQEGALLWKKNCFPKVGCCSKMSRNSSSPVVYRGKVYVHAVRGIQGFDMEGNTVLSVPLGNRLAKDVYSTPCISGDHLFVFRDTALYRVNIVTSQTERLETGLESIASPASDGSHVFFSAGKKRFCVNVLSMETVWESEEGYNVSWNSPLVLENRVMFTDVHECGYLHDKKTGRMLSYTPQRKIGERGKKHASPVYYGNKIFWIAWVSDEMQIYWNAEGYRGWRFWKKDSSDGMPMGDPWFILK